MRFAFATTLWYQEGCKPKTAQELATIRFTSWGGCSESLGFPDGFLVCISVEPPISTSQPVESSWHQRQMADRPAFQSSLPGLCLACSGLLRPLCINSRLETLESCSATQNKKYKNRDNGNILLYLSLSRTSTAFRTFLFPSILTFGAHLLSLWKLGQSWPSPSALNASLNLPLCLYHFDSFRITFPLISTLFSSDQRQTLSRLGSGARQWTKIECPQFGRPFSTSFFS